MPVNDDYGVTFGGAVAVDAGTYVMWGVLLVLALPSVLLMADRVSEPGGAFVTPGGRQGRFAPRPGGHPGRRPHADRGLPARAVRGRRDDDLPGG